MKRLLPPLLLLLFLGFVVWRTAQEPRREAMRDRIAGSVGAAAVSPEAKEQLRVDLDAFLADYGRNPDDRRFAARMLFRAGDPTRALDLLWKDPGYREQPGAGSDLAAMVLERISRLDEEQLTAPERPTNLSAVYLADGGHPEADQHLSDFFMTTSWMVHGQVFAQVVLHGEGTSRSIVGKALRSREEPQAQDSAAILAMRPESYPQRAADVERLTDMVRGNLRKEVRDVWGAAAIALGRSGDPDALKLLREMATQLLDSEYETDQMDGVYAALGMAAGGDWSAWSEVQSRIVGPTLAPLIRQLALRTLAQRWDAGDEAALEPIQTLFLDRSSPDAAGRRLRLATALFLEGPLPDEGDPVSRLAQELDAEGASSEEKVLGAAVRLRRGEVSARDELVAYVRPTLEQMPIEGDPALIDPLAQSSRIQALRALYLYDR